jgi:cell division septation protein DedD
MPHLLDDHDDRTQSPARELTLNTASILGIFLGAVLICGLCFGFGYKLGSHKQPVAEAPSVVASTSDPSGSFNHFKPAAGSADTESTTAPAPKMTLAERRKERLLESAAKEADKSAETQAGVGSKQPASEVSVASPVVASAPGAGAYFVQVAAVSHGEDAQLLLHALKAKGYPVSVHSQSQDKFFHVQVGPFDNKKDAEAAKQRLLGDGYQPIIK